MEIDLDQIKAVAKELTEQCLVAEVKLVNITHARLGGYNARTYSNELQLAETLRTQSIKGVWRWWIRVILSGAAWEMGINDAGPIIELTRKIMGSTESASTLILKLAATPAETEAVLPRRAINMLSNLKGKYPSEDIKKIFSECGLQIPQKLNRRGFINTILPPRLGLLVMDEELSVKELDGMLQMYKAGSLEACVQIYARTGTGIAKDEINVAIGALLLALILQGVGAITRRGFGHFQITCREGSQYPFIKAYVEYVKQLNEAVDASTTRDALNKLIHEAIGSAKRLLEKITVSHKVTETIPPRPSLSFERSAFKLEIVKIDVGSGRDSPEWNLLRCLGFKKKDEAQLKLLRKLGQATLKIEWKRNKGLDIFASGRDLQTWILGLPRSHLAIHSGEKDTGYFLPPKSPRERLEVGRRSSSISFAPLKQISDYEWLVAAYGFLSSDWPERIEWLSGTRGKVSVSLKVEVRKRFDESFQQVVDYLHRGGRA